MENYQSLATESFSYGWLTEEKTSYSHSLKSIFQDNSEHHTFNFDIPFTNSTTIALVHADDIFYDGHIMPVYDETHALSTPSTSIPITPTMISRYSFVDNLQPEICVASTESLDYSGTRFFDHKQFDSNPGYLSRSLSNNKRQLNLLGKWRKSSKRIFEKCFAFVKPFCKTVGCSMKNARVDDLERKVCEIQSWSNSLEASPRASSAYSVVEWAGVKKMFDLEHGIKKVKSWNSSPQASPRISQSRSSNSSYEVESSIHEAIIYCKRSIEKQDDISCIEENTSRARSNFLI